MWECAHLHAFVVELEAVLDATHEDLADLEAVSALLGAALQPAALMRDVAVDNAVTNRLADDVLSIFLGVKVQLDTDVPKGDA